MFNRKQREAAEIAKIAAVSGDPRVQARAVYGAHLHYAAEAREATKLKLEQLRWEYNAASRQRWNLAAQAAYEADKANYAAFLRIERRLPSFEQWLASLETEEQSS